MPFRCAAIKSFGVGLGLRTAIDGLAGVLLQAGKLLGVERRRALRREDDVL